MSGGDGLVPVRITDKNGKQTTVYRREDSERADANATKVGSTSPLLPDLL